MKSIELQTFAISFLLLLVSCNDEDVKRLGQQKSLNITSPNTGYSYHVDVILPDNFDSTAFYKTLYLLDGDWYLDELRNEEIINSGDIVLVSIGYKGNNNRERDFTFPSNDLLENSGGAKEYIQFLNYNLLPTIQSQFNIKPSHSILLGHSLAGYLALYLTFQQDFTNPFDGIIAVSPSLFWNDSYIFFLEDDYSNTFDSLNKRLYIAMGDLEGVAMNTHFDAINMKLHSRNYEGLILYSDRFKNTSHNNSPIKGFRKGLQLILN